MASKKVESGTSSFLLTENTNNQPENDLESTQNLFLNDGNFLEKFRKRMEEMEKAKNTTTTSEPLGADDIDTESSSTTASKLDDSTSKAVKTSVVSQGKRKLLVGRMGGASKQFHAKKKKQEKQAAIAKDSDSNKGENTAWNAYMEEVKKYREGSCTEEVDRIRPLVK